MAEGYVLVQTDGGTAPIARQLSAVQGILSAKDVRGPYDALAFARSAGDEDLEGILAEIRALPGVIRALGAPLAARAEAA